MSDSYPDLTPAQALDEVDRCFGRGSWWHTGNKETYRDLLAQLVAYGVPIGDGVAILANAFAAAADEFGD